jgi:hypothetical protein
LICKKCSFEFYLSKGTEVEDDEMDNNEHQSPEIIDVQSGSLAFMKNNEMKMSNDDYDENNLIYR